MTVSVAQTLFFSLDKPVQLQILKQLPIATLDNISLVCKQSLEIRKEIQEAICHNALPLIKKLNFCDGKGFRSSVFAASVLLSNSKTIEAHQKVEIIQFKNIYDQFSDLAALIPYYSPAENFAEEVISKMSVMPFYYLKLFNLTKNIDYFFKAFPKPLSTNKDPELWINNYCNTVNINSRDDALLLCLLISYAEIASNPKSILEKASTIKNETTALDCFDKFKYSLKIYLVYLKLFPYAKDDNFASLLYEDICNYNTGLPLDNIALKDAITQIVSKNVPLARLFAEKIKNPFMTINAHLAIANITKDSADLRHITRLTSEAMFKSWDTFTFTTYQNVIRTAISQMRDISLARELAAHLINGRNDHKLMTDYTAFKAYAMIYKDFKQPEDLEQAEKIAENTEYAPNKIKAYRTLYELTKDMKFYHRGVNVLYNMKQEDRPHALAEAARLSHYAPLLEMAFEIITTQVPKTPILLKIFKVCLYHFRDFPRAREYISKIKETHEWEGKKLLEMLAAASKEPNDISTLKSSSSLSCILKQLILNKNFDDALAFEEQWYNIKQ